MASQPRKASGPSGLRLTERDLSLLCDLVRFGPLRVDQLADRHAFASERAARDRLRKLVAGGLLVTYFLDTYLATHTGTQSTGLDLRPPGRPGPRLPHDMAVADLAVWLLGREPGSSWVTERELRHGCGLPSPLSGHVPDGKLVLASGQAHAIELELHEKRADQYDRILRWFARALIFDRFRWYVRGAAIERVLNERAERHDLTEFVSVEPVPNTVRVAAWTG